MKSLKIPSLCKYFSTTRHVSSIARDSQTMRLPDERTLGFSECGREEDYPLLYMHGYPSCRLETLGMDELAHRHNLRIITPDRNGYGLTTFNPSLRILDWPADIQALARHLHLERFAILGGSGGSPYALACAHLLPRNTLSGVGIMAGAGPWEAGAHHMSLPYRISALAVHHWPLGYGRLLTCLIWMLKRALSSPLGVRRIDQWLDERSSKLDSNNANNVRREVITRQVLEAFRQGTAPTVHDAQLLMSSWGIEFEDVTYDKVRLWHGTQDANAPVQMVRYMAERLPNCELREFEDDTHFTLHRHLDQILSELVPEHSRIKVESMYR